MIDRRSACIGIAWAVMTGRLLPKLIWTAPAVREMAIGDRVTMPDGKEYTVIELTPEYVDYGRTEGMWTFRWRSEP